MRCGQASQSRQKRNSRINMTIILDFDETLFNTARFKKALAAIFKKHGTDFRGTYNEAKKPRGIYSLKKHFTLIQNADIKKIEKDIRKINFKQFLFPNALNFLRKLKDHDLILLSWGEKGLQKRKIYGLGSDFVSLFDKVIVGPAEKAKVLRKILKLYKSRPVIFIDNDPQELKKIKDNFKDVILVRATRDPSQLKEVEKIIKTY